MKAAVINQWGGPEVFEIKELNKPVPNDGQVLVKVFTSGINPVDWKHRSGFHKYILGAPFPIVLGYDICGEVIKTGKNVKKFKAGDIVFGDLDNKYGGALAEYALGSEHCFVIKPDAINNQQAAAVSLAGLTALQALRDKGRLESGKSVIINGASGGVGHLAVQMSKIMGAKTIAVCGSKSQDFVKKYSPDVLIDYTVTNVLRLNKKVDVFFDISGVYSFVKTKHLLNPGGIYINPHPRIKILIHKSLHPFCDKKKAKTLIRKQNSKDLHTLANWIETGKLVPKIDKVFQFPDISEAHHYSENNKIQGKNIVVISN